MAKSNNLSGIKFGKLTAVEPVGRSKYRQIIWLCRCDCGKEVRVPSGSLRSGNTKSCGCISHRSTGGIGSGKIRRNEITGVRFGKLVAIRPVGRDKNRQTIWECLCDCGNTVKVRRSALVSGNTKSCGCIQNKEHHEDEDDRLYKVWAGMKARCSNRHHSSYRFYGDKGIKVCDEWSRSFLAFRKWALENGYDSKAARGECTIDRIDPFGNYEPSNCRWISISEQQANKRTSHPVD